MRIMALHSVLRDLAKRGRWVVSESTLRSFLPEPMNTYRVAMARHVRANAITRVAPGLYLNPFAPPPAWALERLAAHLRPHDTYYLSLETALHEHGLISQAPSRLTIMTSGRSYTSATPLGVIEFVHTARPPVSWRPRTTFSPERSIHVATPNLALEDLRRVRRNLDLIETE
jgi:predicted transcriptional regulator of viral defense system